MLNDFRLALRLLVKRPGHSLLIISVLAVGIGMSCSFYSVAEAMFLRPLPFDRANQLMDLQEFQGGKRRMTSQDHLDEIRQQSDLFAGVSAYRGAWGKTISIGGVPQSAEGIEVDRYFFPALNVSPALGRTFTAKDERKGAPCAIILSYPLWEHRFSGNPTTIGKDVQVDKEPCTVIAIMPRTFSFPFPDQASVDFWLPLRTPHSEGDKHGIARLKKGTSLRQAQSELDLIAARIEQEGAGKNLRFHLTLYRQVIVSELVPIAIVLGVVMLCILFVVCIDVAGLLLIEAIRYRKEVEIRFALGGGRWKIARLFLIRGVTLAAAGAMVGACVAAALVVLIKGILPAGFPGAGQIGLNFTVLWLAVALALVTGSFFGGWPALAVTQKLCKLSLTQASSATPHVEAARSMRRSRKMLAVLQLMFSSAFLVMAALLGISLYHLTSTDLGFLPDHRLVVVANASSRAVKSSDDALKQFYWQIREQLQAIPGVGNVAISSDPPLTAHGSRPFLIKDVPKPNDPQEWSAIEETTDASYFHVLGIPVLRGRSFSDVDTENGEPVAIVNEAFVKRFFGTDSPVGKQVCIGGDHCRWREIVGIVADARESRIDSPPAPTDYVPFWQAEGGFLSEGSFIVHTRISSAAITEGIQKTIHSLSAATVFGPLPLEEMRSRQLMGSRYRMWFLAAITFLALALAAMGVYGVIAGDVEQRKREIGIRVALGASPRNVMNLFQRQMLFMLIPGLLLGLGLAALLVRYTTSILYGIPPLDPTAYIAAMIVSGAVAFLATLLPVRQALRACPADFLRSE